MQILVIFRAWATPWCHWFLVEALQLHQESPPDFMGKTWENPWFPVDFPFQSSVFYLSGNFGYSPSPASPGPRPRPGPCCLSATP